MAIDAKLAYGVWLQLISDEELYRALIDGSYRELAESRRFGPEHLAVLDQLHAEKGTRWNIENLRFRTALEAGATIQSYLPRTVKMLTNGDEHWLQDICFEYLAYYRWKEHGHYRFTECERFATYVRERIMKRRITPPHLDVVLEFELGVIRLLKRTATIPADQWPTGRDIGDSELAASRPRRAAASELIELPVDIREWVTSGDPTKGHVGTDPVTFLVYVPSLTETHRIKILGEGPRIVLDQFTGERTCEQIAAEIEDSYGIERPQLMGLVRNWVTERVLAVPPS